MNTGPPLIGADFAIGFALVIRHRQRQDSVRHDLVTVFPCPGSKRIRIECRFASEFPGFAAINPDLLCHEVTAPPSVEVISSFPAWVFDSWAGPFPVRLAAPDYRPKNAKATARLREERIGSLAASIDQTGWYAPISGQCRFAWAIYGATTPIRQITTI